MQLRYWFTSLLCIPKAFLFKFLSFCLSLAAWIFSLFCLFLAAWVIYASDVVSLNGITDTAVFGQVVPMCSQQEAGHSGYVHPPCTYYYIFLTKASHTIHWHEAKCTGKSSPPVIRVWQIFLFLSIKFSQVTTVSVKDARTIDSICSCNSPRLVGATGFTNVGYQPPQISLSQQEGSNVVMFSYINPISISPNPILRQVTASPKAHLCSGAEDTVSRCIYLGEAHMDLLYQNQANTLPIVVLRGRTWQSAKPGCTGQSRERWQNDRIFIVNTTSYITTWLCESVRKVLAYACMCIRKCPGDSCCPWCLCSVHRNSYIYK